MRIAILLSGEMRNYDNPAILTAAYKHLFSRHECDVFIATWDRRGESYNQGQGASASTKAVASNFVSAETLAAVYRYIGVKHVEVHLEDEAEWLTSLPASMKSYYTKGYDWSGSHYKGTSVPQFYTLAIANRMKSVFEAKNHFTYDLVIRNRPDNRFRVDFPSEIQMSSSSIATINSRSSPFRTFWPQRIYDIFFFGSSAAMDIVAGGAYDEYMDNVSHPFNNGLHSEDSCRLLFVQALRHGIRVGDVDCDIVMVER